MAHTKLFSVVQKHLREAATDAGPAPATRALTRRQALLFGGAAAATLSLAGCANMPWNDDFDEDAGGPAPTPDVAIVGGGVAGLTVAYRLAKAGKRAVIYEASNRFGGRMFTKKDFNTDGMFVELGGELVDTNHEPLIKLCGELGIGLQRLKPEHNAGEDIFAIGGRVHTEHELLRHGKGAFRPLADRIARDHARLTDANDEWTARAKRLDRMSIAQYLAQFRGHAAKWVIDLVDLAYWGEYGMRTDQQSALNLIDFMDPKPKGDFAMFGESDEVFRIAGGSQTLPDVLYSRLNTNIERKTGAALSHIARDGDGFALTFGNTRARHKTVVLALPFTRLREVGGIDTLGLSEKKLTCIRELGYGDNAKVMMGTTGRPWNDRVAARLPVKPSGEFYAEDFQVCWDTSRGQEGARGILTNYLSGVEDQGKAVDGMHAGLRKISPAMEASLDDNNIASFFWARYPFNKGSFISPKVGQYTTIVEAAGTPELDGRLQFAGEHTSADFAGFMCGGVDSGERVAAALLGTATHAMAPLPRAA